MVLKSQTATLRDLVKPTSRFQRAVNLKYDLGDLDQITAYLPTPWSAAVIQSVLNTAMGNDHQRASLLIGPYGTGKSHLAVVLAAILDGDQHYSPVLAAVLAKLKSVAPETAQVCEAYLESRRRLLPIILSGDEGDLATALGRALERAIRHAEIDLYLPTIYRAALQTIESWASEFPAVYAQFQELGRSRYRWDLPEIQQALEDHNYEAYKQFTSLYHDLAAGATFDPYHLTAPSDLYMAAAKALGEYGYDGLVVLYDEFGRVLETRAGEPFSREAKALQDLAEAAVRSGPAQVHLLLIAHKSLSLYGYGLPDALEQEWRKIEGRFRTLELTTDPLVNYRLISQALHRPDPAQWDEFCSRYTDAFNSLLHRTDNIGVFEFMDDAELRALVIEGAYPLHPLASYCLPRLSQKVAQNERTLFTFLATDDDYALGQFVDEQPLQAVALPLVTLDQLYDYFAGAMRADSGPGGVHDVWAAVESALTKIRTADPIAVRLLKALGVIHAVGVSDRLRPTTELLSFAVAPQEDPALVAQALEYLREQKVVIFRKSVGQWEFLHGSDVDFNRRIAEIIRDRPANPASLRLLLERLLPPRHNSARRYNEERGMVRFFWSLYRAPEELTMVKDWETLLREMDFADGAIIYTLATSIEELGQAEEIAQGINSSRVLVALPQSPLPVRPLLEELRALQELKGDPAFVRDDPRIGQELAFLIEDSTEQLRRNLSSLLDPRRGQRWFYKGRELEHTIRTPGELSRLLSEVCSAEFPSTPRIFNEAFNRHEPTIQQIRAAEKVIDALLDGGSGPTLGLSGRGPEIAIVQSALRSSGILAERAGGWSIGCPDPTVGSDPALAMAKVWDTIEATVIRATENEISFTALIEQLQLPPFGLRLGVIPVLIAAVLSKYLQVTTIRRGGQLVNPLTGATFTELSRRPELFTVQIERWNKQRAAVLEALEAEVGDRVLLQERRHQPLRYLGFGLLRWLQALPRYARDTLRVSKEADRLRAIARLAAIDPAKALLHELPHLLEVDEEPVAEVVRLQLSRLIEELTVAYGELERRLEQAIIDALRPESSNVAEALTIWRAQMEERSGPIIGRLLDDAVSDGLLALSLAARDGEREVLKPLALLLTGVQLRDWTDATEAEAIQRLKEALERITSEFTNVTDLKQETLTEVTLSLPNEEPHTYQFRSVDLSQHAQLLLRNLQHTLEANSRGLTPEERRRIGLELLRSLLEPKREKPRPRHT